MHSAPPDTVASDSLASAPPARAPFEVNLLGCEGDGDEVAFELQVRQYRGGPRQLVLVLEVDDGAGTIHRRAPLVQPLADEKYSVVQESVASDVTEGTCRVTVHDGAVTSIDRASDSLAFEP